MKQLSLKIPQKGGKRKGAGRKRQGARARVSHKKRPRFDKAATVLVTLRVVATAWNLRSQRCFGLIEDCIAGARERFGLRVIEFSVLGNHLHLLVEADTDLALSRGMQGLCVRIARALNRLMKRRGRVFDDHYHARLLHSPTQLVNAIAYVLGNHEHHFGGSRGVDRYSSLAIDRARVLVEPRTWLARTAWRRSSARSPWIERWTTARYPSTMPACSSRRSRPATAGGGAAPPLRAPGSGRRPSPGSDAAAARR